ncbi:MAG: iron uptake porin [Cyanobacteria bacterium J06638_38]
MFNILQSVFKIGVIATVSWCISETAFASAFEPIPSVIQLKKISPTDWEYLTLESLAQRYDCSTPFATGQSDRLLTRFEFALGLKSCLGQLASITNSQDLLAWQKLQRDFLPELARLRTRIDEIEVNLAQVESNQFSPTSKLTGQVLFFLADSVGADDSSEIFSGYRTRIDFDTSFFGEDLLKVRLENRDVGELDDVTGTLLSRLSVDGTSDGLTELAEIAYNFEPFSGTEVVLGTAGVGLNDIGEVLNPFSSSSSGAISRFGRRDPGTLRGAGGAGIGIKQEFGERIFFNAGYLIDSEGIASAESDQGIFNSSASTIAQLVIEPQSELALALTYTHIYQAQDEVNLMGGTGIAESNEPFDDDATTADNLSLQINWEVSSKLEVGGWFGYTKAQQRQGGDASATILNGALTFAFPDLGAEGNEGGIIIGVPPAIANHDDESLIAESTPIHIEALYRISLDERIEITPGVFAIINPDTENGATLWIGSIRTRFSF